MTEIELLESEESKLTSVSSSNEAANILYNIIILSNKLNRKEKNYKNIKQFINYYIESLKSADFGYDNFNYIKIDQLIQLLTPQEQESILQYIISITARELPEYDRSWFVTQKHNAEIKKIIVSNNYLLYPKIILLFFGQSIKRLTIGFMGLFLLTSIILSPAPIQSFVILNISLEDYSNSRFWNHLLNIFSLFAGLDNRIVIKPLNWFGLLIIIFGKLFFIIFITNYIYYKISDKITQK